eukprot:6647889-Pyramimonas_sp.AAC.1
MRGVTGFLRLAPPSLLLSPSIAIQSLPAPSVMSPTPSARCWARTELGYCLMVPAFLQPRRARLDLAKRADSPRAAEKSPPPPANAVRLDRGAGQLIENELEPSFLPVLARLE